MGENGKLKEVVLQDDTRLPADICIMGIGRVSTENIRKKFLKRSVTKKI